MPFENVAETVVKRNSAMATTSKAASAAKKPALPFHDYRGYQQMGGWWISLEEAKANGMGEEWWTEIEQPGSKPVVIPQWAMVQPNKKSSYAKKKESPGKQHKKYKTPKPIWWYENGNMYLGPWTTIRNGKGGRVSHLENGMGVTLKANGNCCVGEYRNGFVDGWGRSFWLENSLAWKQNVNKEEAQIKELRTVAVQANYSDTDNNSGREEHHTTQGASVLVGLPYEYHGKFLRNCKHCPAGKVTLKDGTKRVGPWLDDIAIIFKRHSDTFILPDYEHRTRANWWTDHSECDSIPMDTPRSRKRNRQQCIPISTSTTVAIAAAPAAAKVVALDRKNAPISTVRNYDDDNSSSSAVIVNMDDDPPTRQTSTEASRNGKSLGVSAKTNDSMNDTCSSSRKKVNNLRTETSYRDNHKSGDSKETNDNRSTRGRRKRNGRQDKSAGVEQQQQQQNDDDTTTDIAGMDATVIDADAVVPDEAPSSSTTTAPITATVVDPNAVVPDEAHSSSTTMTATATTPPMTVCMYPDAYLSESEERDFPMHTAVKFGADDFVDEELEKITRRKRSGSDSANDGNGNSESESHTSTYVSAINAVDSKGRTALDLAALTGQLDLVEKLRKTEGSRFLFRAGPRMMIIAKKRSKNVTDYLKQVSDGVE